MSLSQSCVAKLYASVIDDVIGGVREFFMDEGVDEQVLMELRHSWELKLKTTKAVEVPKPEPEPQPPHLKNPPPQPKPAGVAANSQASSGAVNTTNHNNKTVSIQITLPGANVNEGRHITIDVPSSALSGNQLHTVLTGPIISATMALPSNLATTLLQQHVNAALQGHTSSIPLQAAQTLQAVQAVQNSVANGTSDGTQRQTFTQQGGVPQVDGVRDSSDEDDDDVPHATVQYVVQVQSGGVPQVDGVRDSSDEDDNEDDDNDDDEDNEDDDKDEDEDPDATDQNAVEEASEPLNSGDDVSEDDPTDMFETDNVVVCQYDKITRSRNKWKFYLKDGIMNLGGKDFVFQRSSGDAEW